MNFNTIFRRIGRTALVGSLCSGGYQVLWAQGPATGSQAAGLHVDPLHPDASSTVTFTVRYLGDVPHNSLPDDLLDVNTVNDTYRAEVDRQSMATVKGRFSFRVYLNRSASFEKTVSVYEVGEDTTDTFDDTEKALNLHIGPESNSVLGTVSVPIHSPFGPPTALTYKDKDGKIGAPSLQPISIGGSAAFSLTLDNQIKSLKATLGDSSVTSDCPDCWKVSPSAKISQSSMNPGDRITVSFSATASTLRAMRASAMQIGPDKSNDTLRVSIPVTADGGTMRPQVFAVPVRFTPPLTEMIMAILLGACLGGTLRYYLAPAPKAKGGNAQGGTVSKSKDFITGTVLALLCEIVAVVLFVGTNTEVKLIGVSLDPTQLIPAFLLCTLVGGGAAVVNAIKKALGLGDDK